MASRCCTRGHGGALPFGEVTGLWPGRPGRRRTCRLAGDPAHPVDVIQPRAVIDAVAQLVARRSPLRGAPSWPRPGGGAQRRAVFPRTAHSPHLDQGDQRDQEDEPKDCRHAGNLSMASMALVEIRGGGMRTSCAGRRALAVIEHVPAVAHRPDHQVDRLDPLAEPGVVHDGLRRRSGRGPRRCGAQATRRCHRTGRRGPWPPLARCRAARPICPDSGCALG